MKYHTHFDAHNNPILISTRERLLKREKGYVWQDPVHECIPLIGKVQYSDIEVHHKKIKHEASSTRNLEIYKNLEKSGKPFTPRQTCYYLLGDQQKILPILLKSFIYDAPRAEICCEIGYHYKRMNNYAMALKWFQIAANLSPVDSAGFILQDYWGYIPNIESCVCACHLGDYVGAKIFNEQAATFKPDAAAIEINRKYLETILGQ